eukprot:5481724-Heterocapsa_arctica.AAC.1
MSKGTPRNKQQEPLILIEPMGSPTTKAAVAPGKGVGGGWKAKVLMASQARKLTGISTGSCPIG